MALRAVFLDVDGTTVETESRNRRAIEEVARIGGYHIQPDDWNFLAGQGDAVIWQQINSIKPDFCEVFNTASSFERACLNAKLLRVNEIRKVDETAEAIALFRENALLIATVSNAIRNDATASLEMAGYDIASDFLFSMFLEDIRNAGLRPKPHPDPYMEAMRQMNVHLASQQTSSGLLRPEECLVLEDSKTGARSGLQSGMIVVQITDESPALDSDEAAEYEVRYGGKYHPVPRAALPDLCRQLICS